MTQEAVQPRIINGVNVDTLFATLDAIKGQPDLGRFQFRAQNRWIDGAHNQTTITGFFGAGQDQKHTQSHQIDAGEPAVLLGTDTGGQPSRGRSPRAGGVPDDDARVLRGRARRQSHGGRVNTRRELQRARGSGTVGSSAERFPGHQSVLPGEG